MQLSGKTNEFLAEFGELHDSPTVLKTYERPTIGQTGFGGFHPFLFQQKKWPFAQPDTTRHVAVAIVFQPSRDSVSS